MRLRKALWLVGSQWMTSAIGFLGAFILARSIDAAGKGAVNFVQTLAGLTTTILCFGMPGAANYLAAKRLLNAKKGMAFVGSVAMLSTVVALTVLLLAGPATLTRRLGAPSESLLVLAVAAVLPSSLQQGSVNLLLGWGQTRQAAFVQATAAGLTVIVWAVLWATGMLRVPVAAGSWVVAQWVSFALGVYYLSRTPRVEGTPGIGVAARNGFSFGIASWVSSGIHLLALRVDVVILSSLLGMQAVGVYLLGVSLAELSWHVPRALYGVLFPHVASTGEVTSALVARTARQMVPVVLFTAVGTYALAVVVVVPVFGRRFVEVAPVCALLIPGIVAGALGNIWTSYLGGTNRPWKPTLASIVNLLLDIVACLALVPRYGILGAAVATSLSYSAGALLLLVFFSRQAKLSWRTALIPTRDDLAGIRDGVTNLLKERARRQPTG
jgi:O-antigen/teichoic acid export membrane protein